MTCQNCKDPDCKVDAAGRIEREAYDWLQSYGGKIAGDNWKAASEAEEQARSDCAHRAAYSSQHEAIEAAIADCNANTVNWRARALAAEARVAAAIACAKALAADADTNYAKSSTGDYEVGITDAATQFLAALGPKP